MAKTNYIELGTGEQITILYEDRSVIAIDKPAGWMLVPMTWQKTDRNLPAAILSSIASRSHWARSRNLKFLQNVHRLDAETTGILLMVKSVGAMRPFSALFESREMEKRYLVVVRGRPARAEWTCKHPLAPDPHRIGRVRVDSIEGKTAETHFRVIRSGGVNSLLEARPLTGRTHQIRVHAAESGHPVVGDTLYGDAIPVPRNPPPLGLRAVYLSYLNPFDQRRVVIEAPAKDFLRQFGFRPADLDPAAPETSKTPQGPPPAAAPVPSAPAPVSRPSYRPGPRPDSRPVSARPPKKFFPPGGPRNEGRPPERRGPGSGPGPAKAAGRPFRERSPFRGSRRRPSPPGRPE